MLIILMIWEYAALRDAAVRLQALQEQYISYIDVLKKAMKKGKDGEGEVTTQESASPDADELDIDSMIVIDRTPEYLKSSTMDYLKDQQLDALARDLETHEWNNYTDQLINSQKKPVKAERKRLHRRGSSWQSHTKGKRAPLTSTTFHLPIEKSKFWLSSRFGSRKKPSGKWGFHYGIDMAAQRGTPVKASAAGTVEQAGYVSGYGNTILIAHDAVYKTRYAHLDRINVAVGKKVTQGQHIGAVGDTGFTRKVGKDASHLHFELYENGKKINPLYLLQTDNN